MVCTTGNVLLVNFVEDIAERDNRFPWLCAPQITRFAVLFARETRGAVCGVLL